MADEETQRYVVTYDTKERNIYFSIKTSDGDSIPVAKVDNNREVLVDQIFDTFGRNKVIKAEFLIASNKYIVSVLDRDFYVHSHDPKVLIVTYDDLKATIESEWNCVDGMICVSYNGELTLVPRLDNWKPLPLLSKGIPVFIIVLILSIIVYFAKDLLLRDYLLVTLFLKDIIIDYGTLVLG